MCNTAPVAYTSKYTGKVTIEVPLVLAVCASIYMTTNARSSDEGTSRPVSSIDDETRRPIVNYSRRYIHAHQSVRYNNNVGYQFVYYDNVSGIDGWKEEEVANYCDNTY